LCTIDNSCGGLAIDSAPIGGGVTYSAPSATQRDDVKIMCAHLRKAARGIPSGRQTSGEDKPAMEAKQNQTVGFHPKEGASNGRRPAKPIMSAGLVQTLG